MEFEQKVRQKIDHLQSSVNDLRVQQGRFSAHLESEQGTMLRLEKDISRQLEEIKTDLVICKHAIHGNGSPGLKSSIEGLKTQVKMIVTGLVITMGAVINDYLR